MATGPVSDDDRRRVAELHAQGLGRNAIAEQIGRSGSTVSAIAKDLGLSFERGPEVEAATAARVADAKARRARLMNELLDDAEKLRAQLFAPTVIHSFGGRENTYNSKRVDQPPFRDQRDIMAAVNGAINASLRLDLHDNRSDEHEEAASFIGALAVGLDAAYQQLTAADDDDHADDPGS